MLNRIAAVMIYGGRARATLHTDRREIAPGYYAMVTGNNLHDSSVTCEKRRQKIATATAANFDLINRATNAAFNDPSHENPISTP